MTNILCSNLYITQILNILIFSFSRMTFGTALKQVVQNAAESRRLTAGVFECAQHLNK